MLNLCVNALGELCHKDSGRGTILSFERTMVYMSKEVVLLSFRNLVTRNPEAINTHAHPGHAHTRKPLKAELTAHTCTGGCGYSLIQDNAAPTGSMQLPSSLPSPLIVLFTHLGHYVLPLQRESVSLDAL